MDHLPISMKPDLVIPRREVLLLKTSALISECQRYPASNTVLVKKRLDEPNSRINLGVFNNENGDTLRDTPGQVCREHVQRKLTLIRGSSLSLIELPTFLTSPVYLGCQKRATSSTTVGATSLPGLTLSQAISGYQLKTKPGRKRPQWTIMVVALSFFAMCLILIGTTLHFATKYQDQAMASMINISNNLYMLDHIHSLNKSDETLS